MNKFVTSITAKLHRPREKYLTRKQRNLGLFSAERVARARGLWLIALLLFNLVLWGGLGWIALHLLRYL
jgi:hypothetical protein